MAEKNCENCANEFCAFMPPNGKAYCDRWRSNAPTVNRWIPVEDALPGNLTPVIITYANRYPIMPCYQKDKDKPYVGAAYCHNDKWFWYSVTCEDLLAEYGYSFADEIDDAIEVIAWMQMPDAYEPPKEE